MVIDVQHSIYLRQMPAETACQLGFADVLIPHALVQDYLDSGKCRKLDGKVTRSGQRNVLPIVDACGDRFFQRIYRTHQRFIMIFSKRRQFGKIRSRNKYRSFIVLKIHRITKQSIILH